MSLYRQPGRVSAKTLALVAVAGVVVGLAAGFALGRGTASDPTLADKMAELRSDLRPARAGVEQTAVEYSSAVSGGKIVEQTEYEAAQASVRRARVAIEAARGDLLALSEERAGAVKRSVDDLSGAVETRADPARVEKLSSAAGDALLAAIGG